jgi:uncharacterized DUF497 family protein
MTFEWDDAKDLANQGKHGVTFEEAQGAFADPRRLIVKDDLHSSATETRYYCYGKVQDSVLTVRFTLRGDAVRIIGAAHWRKGKRLYEDR